MKNAFLSLIGILIFQMVIAQNDPNYSNPNNSGQTTTNQNVNQARDNWDLYNATMLEKSRVPESASTAFNTKYANQNNVIWYSYPKGYIATYPGDDKMYRGVLYDKNGKMVGTVERVKYSTLSTTVTGNIKKKYPNYSGEYVYQVTTPDGKKTYVSNMNGQWSGFDDQGNYMQNQ